MLLPRAMYLHRHPLPKSDGMASRMMTALKKVCKLRSGMASS